MRSSSSARSRPPEAAARERRERLAAVRGHPVLRRQLHGALEMPAHLVRLSPGGVQPPPPALQLAGAERRGALGRDRRRPIEPLARDVHLVEFEVSHPYPAGGEELELPVADLLRASVGLLAA